MPLTALNLTLNDPHDFELMNFNIVDIEGVHCITPFDISA